MSKTIPNSDISQRLALTLNREFRFHKATTRNNWPSVPNLVLRMDLDRDETNPPNYQAQGKVIAGLLVEVMPTATLVALAESLTERLSSGE